MPRKEAGRPVRLAICSYICPPAGVLRCRRSMMRSALAEKAAIACRCRVEPGDRLVPGFSSVQLDSGIADRRKAVLRAVTARLAPSCRRAARREEEGAKSALVDTQGMP